MNKDVKNKTVVAKPKAYRQPELTEYGSIELLTRDNTLSASPEGPGQGNLAKKPL